MEADGVDWLQVDHDPSDPRPAVFPALGNLVDLVRAQTKAYGARR